MIKNTIRYFALVLLGSLATDGFSQNSQSLFPQPYGALPAQNQLNWHELEMYVLIHFTPTTFENKEWGYGDADPGIFNPSQFNAQQIADAAAAGGFKGLIFVAKHHDGFALWPTRTTAYNISKSPWKNGNGDMVKEFEQAARKNGMQFGVYCSPWDRNFPAYGTHEYVKAYREQLKELYSRYGKLFITWFDGANGGDGYYGGAREKRNIDRTSYYGWDTTWNIVRQMQPGAVIFSDMGDVRWVGNEEGHAAETSWATFTPEPVEGKTVAVPGEMKYWKSPEGTRNGAYWKPAECDVPLRPGWFYHPDQDKRVKTPAQLFDLYFKSVGRGAALDLGLSPDKRGLLHDNDVESLSAFGRLLKETFSMDLAKTAKLLVSNIRGNKRALFGVKKLVDDDRYSYWATDDQVTSADLVLEWKKPVKFNIIRIRENIQLGQRIEKVAIDARIDGQWKEVAQASSIGSNRLVRLKEFITTESVRLRVLQSPVCLAISEIGVFKEPDQLPEVSYSHWKATGGLDKKGWTIHSVSYESRMSTGAAKNAIDGDPNTIWHTWDSEREMKAPPQEIVVDMGAAKNIRAFTYLPRLNGAWGIVANYEWQVSSDGIQWQTVATGEFSNIKANPIEQMVSLPAPVSCRYFKFIGKTSVEDNYISAAELGAVEADR
ncbi:alpha-L-fucosidase [Flavihumibacter stibioxidans]|uniref:alpha-L-fucosidase n=1 Tax=Flavihumibacter stibioxidans TaxID=1834163 RepID=A0ABR7M848_9BACT|nr:alpha-L-fucosidase [Flavihumibacter stibioxidans]MBC6491205.1 alpha-L-fucosidase [Flavihumibacter stibioxidans]